jgi:molybdate transport system substrate-binding protein
VKGDAEIGLWQVSEILEASELDLAGPLPADIQHYTTYTAGTPTNAKELPAAKALVEFLTSPRAATILRSKGLEPG